MNINGEEFPNIVDIREISVKNGEFSENFSLGKDVNCIVIQGFPGESWIFGSSPVFPIVDDSPATIRGERHKIFKLKAVKLSDLGNQQNFTLIFVKACC